MIIVYPSGLTIILSIPLGPIEVFKILAIERAAVRFYLIASIPFTLFFFSYSLTIMYGLPNSSKAKLIYSL